MHVEREQWTELASYSDISQGRSSHQSTNALKKRRQGQLHWIVCRDANVVQQCIPQQFLQYLIGKVDAIQSRKQEVAAFLTKDGR